VTNLIPRASHRFSSASTKVSHVTTPASCESLPRPRHPRAPEFVASCRSVARFSFSVAMKVLLVVMKSLSVAPKDLSVARYAEDAVMKGERDVTKTEIVAPMTGDVVTELSANAESPRHVVTRERIAAPAARAAGAAPNHVVTKRFQLSTFTGSHVTKETSHVTWARVHVTKTPSVVTVALSFVTGEGVLETNVAPFGEARRPRRVP
jgi:hypothetical protein